jgi:hypothetical protein
MDVCRERPGKDHDWTVGRSMISLHADVLSKVLIINDA